MLDFKRDYITIHGDTDTGHRYEQDGILYDGSGEPIKKQPPEGKKALEAKAAEAKRILDEAQAAIQASDESPGKNDGKQK